MEDDEAPEELTDEQVDRVTEKLSEFERLRKTMLTTAVFNSPARMALRHAMMGYGRHYGGWGVEPKLSMEVTDAGVVMVERLPEDRVRATLTRWEDVEDIEVSHELTPTTVGYSTTLRLSIQYPRVSIELAAPWLNELTSIILALAHEHPVPQPWLPDDLEAETDEPKAYYPVVDTEDAGGNDPAEDSPA